jgi:membrane protein
VKGHATRRAATRLRAEVRLTLLAIWRGVTGVYQSEDLTFASSIAYYSLLSLFPFFLLAIALLGSFTAEDADRQAILGFVLRYFPRQFEFVNDQIEALQQASVRLSLVGGLLMAWAAMGVFGAVTSAVNHAWGVEKQPSYFKHKLISFVMMLAAGVLLIGGVLLVSAINVVEASWFAGVMSRWPELHVLGGIAVRWASTIVFIVIVGLIF